MEETKKYEGTVCITSAEYRELVTEAVHYKHEYESTRSKNWQIESENRKMSEELAKIKKKVAYYERIYGETHESLWNV